MLLFRSTVCHKPAFRKTTDIYLQLFSELEGHAERLHMRFDSRHVMTDFEMALIKAVKQAVSFYGFKMTFTFSFH